jgi:LmbE family N-acetylglucosaminyl deacetylase
VLSREAEYSIVLFSHCDNSQVMTEWRRAVDVMGIDKRFTRFWPRRKFNLYQHDIVDMLYRIREHVNPDIVLAPGPRDPHPDHQVISRAAVAIFGKDTTLLFYGNHNYEISANYHVLMNEDQMIRKADLLALFQSQQHRDYFHPDIIWARHVWQKAGQFAEHYRVYSMNE